MKRSTRKALFLVAAAALACVLLVAMFRLPAVGGYHGVYGETINGVAVPERSVTDAVSAVNFDYRGVDTLGEEFILFTSVLGVVLLLRAHHDERESRGSNEGEQPNRPAPRSSNAVRVTALALVGINVVFGVYVVTHGQVTPGGGFQGGVILATAPLLAYLAGGADVFARIAPERLVEVAEAFGAGAFAVIGLAGLLAGGAFLQNVLPYGTPGEVTSGGTVPWISAATGLEVAGGFVLALTAFLDETRKRRATRGRRAREGAANDAPNDAEKGAPAE